MSDLFLFCGNKTALKYLVWYQVDKRKPDQYSALILRHFYVDWILKFPRNTCYQVHLLLRCLGLELNVNQLEPIMWDLDSLEFNRVNLGALPTTRLTVLKCSKSYKSQAFRKCRREALPLCSDSLKAIWWTLIEDVNLQEETGRSSSKGMHFQKVASCSCLPSIYVNIWTEKRKMTTVLDSDIWKLWSILVFYTNLMHILTLQSCLTVTHVSLREMRCMRRILATQNLQAVDTRKKTLVQTTC